jgi:hypothetical protein
MVSVIHTFVLFWGTEAGAMILYTWKFSLDRQASFVLQKNLVE